MLCAGIAAAATPNPDSGFQWTRAVEVTRRRCATATDVYPDRIDPDYSILNADVANNAMRCTTRLRGVDKGYVLLYALTIFATIDYGRDSLGLHRENNLRQERLIEAVLKTPNLPGVLRHALRSVEEDLLNYDALHE